MALATPVGAGTMERKPFGAMPDGTLIEAVTLTNARGLKATVLTLGASLQSVIVPDRDGHMVDVLLGYDDLAGYLRKSAYFGATVGRVANRIAKGHFTLDGRVYQLAVNDGPNALHGGKSGFDKRVWEITGMMGGAKPSVMLRHVSPHGEEGYPGTLTATATFSLDDTGALAIDYAAMTEKPTIVNLSNHSYWNLAGAGAGDALGMILMIPADAYVPTDGTSIPLGTLSPVGGTLFDFRTPTVIGSRIRDGRDAQLRIGRGYDHHWQVGKAPSETLRLLARLEDPRSGRVMEMLSNQPGLQFYTGNFLDGTISGKGGRIYRQGDGVALEPQMVPDTVNQPLFGSVRLDPGQTYSNHVVFRFSVR